MKFFGTTIKETIDCFKPVHLEGSRRFTKGDKMMIISRLVITILLIFAATFLFLQDNESSKAGATIYGAILGYWLK